MPIDQRALHEQLQIFGDTLIGVVGGIAEQLHAIMVRGVEPLPQIGLRHPAPPADLQPQIQIVLVHREHGVDRRDRAKEQDGADEGFEISILQGVVKAIVPFVQDHLDGDERQLDGDHRAEQEPARASGPRSDNTGRPAARSWPMSRPDFSRKTSDVEERNAVQCGTIDAHRRGFTRCNGQSRVGALQYHKPIRARDMRCRSAIGERRGSPLDVVRRNDGQSCFLRVGRRILTCRSFGQ